MASTSPGWASETTSTTPKSPRSKSERHSASQPCLGGGHLDTEDLALAFGVHARYDEHVDVDGSPCLLRLHYQRICPDDLVGTSIEGMVAEGLHLGI
jgi:hypothetical protein